MSHRSAVLIAAMMSLHRSTSVMVCVRWLWRSTELNCQHTAAPQHGQPGQELLRTNSMAFVSQEARAARVTAGRADSERRTADSAAAARSSTTSLPTPTRELCVPNVRPSVCSVPCCSLFYSPWRGGVTAAAAVRIGIHASTRRAACMLRLFRVTWPTINCRQ